MRLGLTMRVVQALEYCEPRDALSHAWATYIGATLPECKWLPIPNIGAAAPAYLQTWGIQGIVLTGGEDIADDIRTYTESSLLRHAASHKLPVLGICRGLQLIQLHCGGSLGDCPPSHCSGRRHEVRFTAAARKLGIRESRGRVNSFHRRGIRSRDLAAPLVALALADDEWIEAAISEDPPMLGLMWHPEREERLQRVDATMVRWIFGI